MKNLKKNLQSLNMDLKALAKKTDTLIVAFEKLEKSKSAKIKPAKKMPVKKHTVRKAGKIPATDIVFGVIDAAGKKGIKTGNLIMTTRFSEKKILNLVYRLKKQGKIKRVEKGLYVKA
jgi:predicted Rossmann fold nucleotide-binding protein DprA/Smf involved in DNA uptake